MQIKFIQLKIEGFGSIHDELVFKLDLPGFNIIQAKNGSGKSSILSAICWALWGNTLKKKNTISTYPEMRLKSYLGTKVELSFISNGISYVAVRTKDYKGVIPQINGKPGSDLFIFKEGKLMNFKDKGETKAELQNLVGYSFDLFKNSVVFGQRVSRIISESGPKQKEVLEQAFEVQYINRAKDKSEKEYKKAREEFAEKNLDLERLNNRLAMVKVKMGFIKERIETFNMFKEGKVKGCNILIAECHSNIKDLKKQLRASKEIEDKILVLSNELDQASKLDAKVLSLEKEEFMQKNKVDNLETKLSVLVKEKESIKLLVADKNLSALCEQCNQPLNAKGLEFAKARRKKRYNELKPLIEQLTSTIEEENKKLSAITHDLLAQKQLTNGFDDKRTKWAKLKKNLIPSASIKRDIEGFTQTIQAKELEIIEANNSKPDTSEYKILKGERKQIKEKLATLKVEVKKAKKHLEVMDWLYNQALSNKGLKAYIFSSMLSEVNSRLAHYSKFIEFRAKIDIDLESANKNVTIRVFNNDVEVSVDDLSGGQSQLIDIVIAFSIHDVVSSDKQCNLLFMDEVFEGLDQENVELVTNLIRSKARGLSLFLITHLSTFQVSNSNIISFKLNSKKHTVPA